MLPAYKTILCCHGFGTQATEVLRHAFGIAKCYDARVVIIHVLEPPNPQAQHMLDTYLPPEKFADIPLTLPICTASGPLRSVTTLDPVVYSASA